MEGGIDWTVIDWSHNEGWEKDDDCCGEDDCRGDGFCFKNLPIHPDVEITVCLCANDEPYYFVDDSGYQYSREGLIKYLEEYGIDTD